MAQFNWTYLDQNNRAHNVGLFHGDRTGHVIVYCNKKVVTIDFKVLDSKSYSLFINEELCQIEIKHKGNYQFSYHFHMDREVDTPLNRMRKADERKHWKQTLLFFGGLLLLVFLIIGGARSYKNYQANSFDEYFAKIDAAHEVTSGKVLKIDSTAHAQTITFGYVVNNQAFTNSANTRVLEKSLFPIKTGDEFVLKFNPQFPNKGMLITSQPTDSQINTYVDNIHQIHSKAHPNLTNEHILCQIRIAFELEQIDGLADFYYQNTSVEQNPNNNTKTYLRLIRDLPFKNRADKECW